MSLLGTNLIVLALMTVAFWWLSGFDTRLSGTNRVRDFTRRAVRCGASLVVVEFCLLSYAGYVSQRHPAAGYIYPLLAVPLVFIWWGCLRQMGGQLFKSIIEPDDSGPFQPNRDVWLLDQIAELIRQGKKEQARSRRRSWT